MTEFILRVITCGGYWGIALLMALENVFPPIPSEVIMGFGGVAVARGQFEFLPLLIVGTLGSTAGNYVWYMIGARLGTRGLKPFVDRWGRWLTIDWQDVEALRERFRERGGRIVFTFRFLPTFRTMVSLPAGMAHMPRWRFLAFTFAGSLIWNAGLIGGGYVLGTQFEAMEQWVGWGGAALVVLFVGWYLYRVATWRPRHARG